MEKQIQKEDEVSLKEVILKFQKGYKYLLSKWVIIFMVGTVGGGIGLTYAYFQKPVYVAELTFVVEDAQSRGAGGGYASIAGQLGIDLGGSSGGGAFAGDNLLALMKSRTMIIKTLLTTVNIKGKNETLAEFYIGIKNQRQKWKEENSKFERVNFLSGVDPSTLTLEQSTLLKGFYSEIVSKNLVVEKSDKKTDIISVQVKSENELFSKYFTDILAKEVSDFYVDTKTKKSAENLAILQHQVDSVKIAFNLAVNGVANSTDANPNPNPNRVVLRVPSQRRQFDVQVNQAILSQLIQNLELAKVSLRKETPLIQVIDKPILPLNKIEANRIKAIMFGFFLGVFTSIALLLFNMLWKSVMAKNQFEL